MWQLQWMSISDAAKVLGRSRRTIHNWINRGWIKANRIEGYRTFVPILTRRRGHVTESAPDFRASAKK